MVGDLGGLIGFDEDVLDVIYEGEEGVEVGIDVSL